MANVGAVPSRNAALINPRYHVKYANQDEANMWSLTKSSLIISHFFPQIRELLFSKWQDNISVSPIIAHPKETKAHVTGELLSHFYSLIELTKQVYELGGVPFDGYSPALPQNPHWS